MKSKDFQQTREATKKKRHTYTYTLKLSADRVFPTVAIVVIHVDDPFFCCALRILCVYFFSRRYCNNTILLSLRNISKDSRAPFVLKWVCACINRCCHHILA